MASDDDDLFYQHRPDNPLRHNQNIPTPTMVEKTLSSGTLNLRFMQNARRAQQLPPVDPEQARVKDDAEWEVSPEIREAWGPSAYRSEKA